MANFAHLESPGEGDWKGQHSENFSAAVHKVWKFERWCKAINYGTVNFHRTMSNTAPAYLEGFQRIVISVDEISGPDDIKHFVSDHKDLTVSPEVPEFERHPYMTGEAVS